MLQGHCQLIRVPSIIMLVLQLCASWQYSQHLKPVSLVDVNFGLVFCRLDPLLELLVFTLWPKDGADLASCGPGLGGALISKAAREPAVSPLAAVHPHVKAGQLSRAQQAGRGTPQGAILLLPPHYNVATSLASHPGHNSVFGNATLARLIHPPAQKATLCKQHGCTISKGEQAARVNNQQG